LYLLLFAVPLTGWYVLSRMGLRVSVVGWNLPAIAMQAPDHASAVVGPVHQLAGTLLLIVAGLHAVVALWHQFVIKDKLMRRMNPI
jgi:cytochrome b561